MIFKAKKKFESIIFSCVLFVLILLSVFSGCTAESNMPEKTESSFIPMTEEELRAINESDEYVIICSYDTFAENTITYKFVAEPDDKEKKQLIKDAVQYYEELAKEEGIELPSDIESYITLEQIPSE